MSDRTVYRVREGVEWVNGARVPPDRKVRLAEVEARFDLEQGRIEPLPRKRTPRPRQETDDGWD